MRILIIKTSSLGDVVHMLPAISDAVRSIPEINIDWVVEESFRSVPAWHPNVEHIFKVAIRRWRKQLFSTQTRRQIHTFRNQIKEQNYDKIIDSQGLIKSALICRWARGERIGYDRQSAREPLASWAYDQPITVDRNQHAINRNRQLCAAALDYSLDQLPLDYGLKDLSDRLVIDQNDFAPIEGKYLLGLHGTSRVDKEWPEQNWLALAQYLDQQQSRLVLPWGNSREHERAQRIAAKSNALVLPKLSLDCLAQLISQAQAVVGMDTGLMHIAAALGRPGVALYPATKPTLTGVLSAEQDPQIINLQGLVSSDEVINRLAPMLTKPQ